jgi:LacI family transcriptional regulator/LacI family fructose operon transcriptional repressor
MPTVALSLQAIANQAGVSKMSVSRALSKKPGVSKETREKILKIAQEKSYRPNPLITALMTNLRVQRSRRAVDRGTVLAFIERADVPIDIRAEHFKGAEQAAKDQGYKLEPFIVGDAGLKASRLNNILLTRNIPGMIIAPLPEAHGHFDLDWSQFCTVTIEYTFVEPAFDRVVHDSYASMRLILEKCRSRGLCRVGLLFTANGRDRTEGLNEAAYWMEQKTLGVFSDIPPLCHEEWNEKAVYQWYEHHKPDVIITSARFYLPLKSFLKKHRIRVPADCSIVNVNLLDSREGCGVNQNNEIIGATAAQLLIDKINRNDCGIPDFPKTILTTGKWVEGTTLRPPAVAELSC